MQYLMLQRPNSSLLCHHFTHYFQGVQWRPILRNVIFSDQSIVQCPRTVRRNRRMVSLAAVPPLQATQKDGAGPFLPSIGSGSSSSRVRPASLKCKHRLVVSKTNPGRLPTWSQRGKIDWSMRSSPPNHPGLPASSAPPASAAMNTSPSPASHRIPDEHRERLFGSRTKPTSTRQKPSNASIPATSNSISYI